MVNWSSYLSLKKFVSSCANRIAKTKNWWLQNFDSLFCKCQTQIFVLVRTGPKWKINWLWCQIDAFKLPVSQKWNTVDTFLPLIVFVFFSFNRVSFFVWDFPTLSQERRYFFICLYTRATCLWRGLYWKGEDPGNECLSVAAFSSWPVSGVSVGESFRLVFSVWSIYKVKGSLLPPLLTYFIVLSKLCWL